MECRPERDKLEDYLGSEPERDKFHRKSSGTRNTSAEEIRTEIGRMFRCIFMSCIYSGYFILMKGKLGIITLRMFYWLRDLTIWIFEVSTTMIIRYRDLHKTTFTLQNNLLYQAI